VEKNRSVAAWLVLIAAQVLLLYHVAGDVWSLFAHYAYGAFLLGVMVAQLLPFRRPEQIKALITVMWWWLTITIIVAAYTPTGWQLWVRVILFAVVSLQTFSLWKREDDLKLPGVFVAAAALSVMLLFTYGLDRAVGVASGGRKPGGIVFPRNNRITYDTTEFTFTAHINTYGFRGPDVNLNDDVDCRVMLLGDSFTYGWGADYENTWGARLEQQLNTENISAQVLNLGAPGANIADYALLSKKAVPLLQPDVILVGVLQGDDMRQVTRDIAGFPRELTFGDHVHVPPATEYLIFHYPFIAERTVLSRTTARAVQRNWQTTAETYRSEYTERPDWERQYMTLDAEVRDLFLDGKINPHFIEFAIVMSDYWMWALQDPETLEPYKQTIVGDFLQLAQAARGARVSVVSVPHGAYTQAESYRDLEELGFTMRTTLLETTLMDDVIEGAANTAGIEFLSVTETFRQHDELAFYPLDGHFNDEGNRLFAEAVYPHVRELCSS